MEATKVYCNNQSCIKLSENPVFHDRSKHIDMRCHFIKDNVQRGVVPLQYAPTREQVVDILINDLGITNFTQFREQLGMIENRFQWQEQDTLLGDRANNKIDAEGAVVKMQQ